ncbi:hypothetical protein [Streptosporangium sp. NPDC023615]|uniref:hypothetical protein n=1 Tax=Streptosporangium sp. NPDC023615 TaxID=3154794 RepID=UPI003412BD08
MNPVVVMRAARTVRDELDSLMGGAADGLRGRLDPLLAEAGTRPPERLADAVILMIAEYGPAWDRFTALLSLDRGLTAEQVIPLLSRPAGTGPGDGPGAEPAPSGPDGTGLAPSGRGVTGLTPSGFAGAGAGGTEPPGAAPRGPDALDAPSTASYTPDWLLPGTDGTDGTGGTDGTDRIGDTGGAGGAGAGGVTGPGAGGSGGYGLPEPGGLPAGWGRPGHTGEDLMPSTGAMSFDWARPGQTADSPPPPGASPASPPAFPAFPAHTDPSGPPGPPGPPAHAAPPPPPPPTPPTPPPSPTPAGLFGSHEPSGPQGPPGQQGLPERQGPPGQQGPSGPPPASAGGRGSSVLDRLTGAFRKRRRETPAGPQGTPGPPWEAVPLIEAPAEAVAGWGVEVSIGVAPAQGSAGTATPAEPVELEVQIVAEGFDAPGGWRVRLRADAASPYPRATVNLVAPAQEEPEITRQIQAICSVGGQVAGFGLGSITIHDSPGRLGRQETPGPVTGTRVRPALTGEAPDVTAVVVHGDEPGRLWWTYLSPHFVTPDRAEPCDLGVRASEFGRRLTGQGRLSEDLGREIGSRVPWGFWELLNAVAARVAPRRPSVLFLSQESHVPWELAALEHPYDPSIPSHLSCQAVTGRWPLGGRRPELPPPAAARADRVVVVCDEGRTHPLVTEYGATRVSPALGDVLDVFEQGADVVHFAAGGPASEVLGRDLAGAPFVFLEEPGDAQAFLLAGACAVVAPLWPAGGDDLAREFYGRCLAGEAAAEVLRSMRGRSPGDAGPYRLHGHPGLRLHRTVPPSV